jgi:hypothetical protein
MRIACMTLPSALRLVSAWVCCRSTRSRDELSVIAAVPLAPRSPASMRIPLICTLCCTVWNDGLE